MSISKASNKLSGLPQLSSMPDAFSIPNRMVIVSNNVLDFWEICSPIRPGSPLRMHLTLTCPSRCYYQPAKRATWWVGIEESCAILRRNIATLPMSHSWVCLHTCQIAWTISLKSQICTSATVFCIERMMKNSYLTKGELENTVLYNTKISGFTLFLQT